MNYLRQHSLIRSKVFISFLAFFVLSVVICFIRTSGAYALSSDNKACHIDYQDYANKTWQFAYGGNEYVVYSFSVLGSGNDVPNAANGHVAPEISSAGCLTTGQSDTIDPTSSAYRYNGIVATDAQLGVPANVDSAQSNWFVQAGRSCITLGDCENTIPDDRAPVFMSDHGSPAAYADDAARAVISDQHGNNSQTIWCDAFADIGATGGSGGPIKNCSNNVGPSKYNLNTTNYCIGTGTASCSAGSGLFQGAGYMQAGNDCNLGWDPSRGATGANFYSCGASDYTWYSNYIGNSPDLASVIGTTGGQLNPFNLDLYARNTIAGGFGAETWITFTYPLPTPPAIQLSCSYSSSTTIFQQNPSVGLTFQMGVKNTSATGGPTAYFSGASQNASFDRWSVNGDSVSESGSSPPSTPNPNPPDIALGGTVYYTTPGATFGPPGGPSNQVTVQWWYTYSGTQHNCSQPYTVYTVYPYMTVTGGDSVAGSTQPYLGSTSCPASSVDGAIIGPDTTNNNAGDQFALQALGIISGFASADVSAAGTPNGLDFSNTDPTTLGDFGAAPCMPSFTPQTTSCTSLSPNLGDPTTFAEGTCNISGDLAVGSTGNITVLPSSNLTVFVGGNLYIDGNITFAGGWDKISDIPQLNFVVTGNIYIMNNVTEIDGLYDAVGAYSAATNDDVGSNIYTCEDSSIRGYAGGADCGSYNSGASTSLNVDGSLIANDIAFERTYGDVNGLNGDPENPAAETFNYGPASWLAGLTEDVLPYTYSSITDLPPVL